MAVSPASRLRLTKDVATGSADAARPGTTIGFIADEDGDPLPIVSAGPVLVGTHRYIIGVVPGGTALYLLSGKKLWRLRACLPIPSPPVPFEAEGRHLWADSLARACMDLLTSPAEQRVVAVSTRRYRATVRACVEERMLAAAEYGEVRTYESYAHAVCVLWTTADLLEPAIITLHHALQVSLALALPPDRACKLLEFAAFLEHKAHLLDRPACRAIYERACQNLSILVPAWAAQGHLTDWRLLGDLERVWRSQYARLMREAALRDITPEQLLQMGATHLVAELLQTDAPLMYEGWRATSGTSAAGAIGKPPVDDTPTIGGQRRLSR